jgi:VanZ family protein
LFWAAAAFALAMALNPHPPHFAGEPSDKVEHMFAFAVLGLLAALAWPRASVLKLLASLSLFGALIEVLQAIPALHRDSDIVDWIADTVAAGLVFLAGAAWRARTR